MNHAILRLEEERRILADVYRAIQQDTDLEGMDRATRDGLLAEIRRELKDVAVALRILRNRLLDEDLIPAGIIPSTEELAHA